MTKYSSSTMCRAFCVLRSAYCLLPSGLRLLPTALRLPSSAFCLLPTAFCLLLSAYCLLPTAARAQDDVVLRAMRDELDRSMKQLQLENLEKPYFIAYHVQDTRMLNASATFGALLAGNIGRARTLAVEVRVGSYQLDNSNFFSYPPGANGLSGVVLLPSTTTTKSCGATSGWRRTGRTKRRWKRFPASAPPCRIGPRAKTFRTSPRSQR